MSKSQPRKTLFADHRRVGKKFIPPMAGYSEIQFAERILPEIIWVAYLINHAGPKKGVEIAGLIIESCSALRLWEVQPDFSLLSCYRNLEPTEWTRLEKLLKGKGVFLECLDALTPFVKC